MTTAVRAVAASTWVLAGWTLLEAGIIYAASFSLALGVLPRAWSSANVGLACWYAVPVLLIFMAHELGHRVACRRHGVRTGPMFAVPMPFGVLPWHLSAFGIVGAFLVVPKFEEQPAIVRWDIAAAGVLAGAAAATVCTMAGYMMSVPSAGNPLHPFMPSALMEMLIARQPIEWHPLFAAGWVGWILTSISLFPLPRFDGGRLLAVDGSILARRPKSAVALLCLAIACWWPSIEGLFQ